MRNDPARGVVQIARCLRLCVSLTLAFALEGGTSRAASTSGDQQTSEIIKAIDAVCKDVPLQASSRSIGWEASAKAGVSKLLHDILDVGFSVSRKSSRSESIGFQQDQLASAFIARERCASTALMILSRSYEVRSIRTGRAIPPRLLLEAARTPSNKLSSLPPSSSETSQSGSDNLQQSNFGSENTNTSNTNNQNGTVNCSSPGCKAVGVEVSPPVTPDERQQALDRLVLELRELARFPREQLVGPPPTVMEQHLTSPTGYKLYHLLRGAYEPTILALPYGAKAMDAFEASYYQYEATESDFELRLSTELGKVTAIQSVFAWNLIRDYMLGRALGLSADSYKNGAYFFNYGVSQGEAERVYQAVQANQDVASVLSKQVRLLNENVETANRLLADYR